MALFFFFMAIPGSWLLFAAVTVVVGWSILVRRPLKLGGNDSQARRGFYGPLVVAGAFALVSIPIVAVSLGVLDSINSVREDSPMLPVDDIRRFLVAAGCAVPSVLVAASLGAPAVRRHRAIGGIFTFLVALLVAITALPVVLAQVDPGIGVDRFCLDSCSALIEAGNPGNALLADVFYSWAPLVEPVSVAVLALGVAAWTFMVRAWFDETSRPNNELAESPIGGALVP